MKSSIATVFGISAILATLMPGTRLWRFESNWRDILNAESIRQAPLVLRLMESIAWRRLAPDVKHEFVIAGFGEWGKADYATAAPADGRTVLAVQDTRFTLNGKPTFLLGISYYGALGAPEDFIRLDLDDLQRHGFNWLRVWATWGPFDHDISVVDAQGRPREPFVGRLKWLVAECDHRGLVVDVTLTRGKGSGCLPDLERHQRAVETVVNVLKEHHNWYMDLANERDVRDDRYVPIDEIRSLRELVRRLDPSRLVTASFGGHDLSEEDIREALLTAGLDFLCPHRPRSAESPGQTKAQAQECLAMMKAIGRMAPVHYQEPFRRGYSQWEPLAADFLADLRGAMAGGAAGWCLHNGQQQGTAQNRPRRSFDLRDQRLFEQLDEQERAVVARAATEVRSLPRLKVADTGRLLIAEAGEPFLWLGDTAWKLRTIKPDEVDYVR